AETSIPIVPRAGSKWPATWRNDDEAFHNALRVPYDMEQGNDSKRAWEAAGLPHMDRDQITRARTGKSPDVASSDGDRRPSGLSDRPRGVAASPPADSRISTALPSQEARALWPILDDLSNFTEADWAGIEEVSAGHGNTISRTLPSQEPRALWPI